MSCRCLWMWCSIIVVTMINNTSLCIGLMILYTHRYHIFLCSLLYKFNYSNQCHHHHYYIIILIIFTLEAILAYIPGKVFLFQWAKISYHYVAMLAHFFITVHFEYTEQIHKSLSSVLWLPMLWLHHSH